MQTFEYSVLADGSVWDYETFRWGVCWRRYVTAGRLGVFIALPHFESFLFAIGNVISQFPAPATCCHASLAIKDSPSETVSSNKLVRKLLLVVVFYHRNKVTPAEVGTREWAAAVRS